MSKAKAEMKPEEIHRRFAELFNAGEVGKLVELYEDDAVFVPEPGRESRGKTEIREALKSFLALNGKLDIKTRYAVNAGDVALLSCEWTLKGKGEDGKPIELSGKTSEVVRRQTDGRWLYILDHPYGGE